MVGAASERQTDRQTDNKVGGLGKGSKREKYGGRDATISAGGGWIGKGEETAVQERGEWSWRGVGRGA